MARYGRALLVAPALLVLAAAACGGDGATDTTRPEATAVGAEGESAGSVLAAGTFSLPAAEAFGEAGFHESVLVTAVAPEAAPAGRRLVVSLRDASRRQQVCSRQHPLSGCATVDWSDDESRPNVPPGGVFENRLTLALTTGPIDLFFHESGELTPAPESFKPG